MNKIFLIVGLSLLIIGLPSCSDWLDLRPESEIVLDDFWQDESEVTQVLSACYRSLTEGGVMQNMLIWGELRSDNVVSGGRSDMPRDMIRLLNGDVTPDNGYANWGAFYTVINYCNTFLHYAPEVVNKDENFTLSDFNSLKAEVLTIRALCYFYLVRTFKEVPWIETPSIADNQDYRIEKSSEEYILNKLLEDLTFAERYSRDKFETNMLTKARITKSAVRSLMADIYMWTGDYDEAIDYCNRVLANSDLELVNGENVLSTVFYRKNSKESIFELQFDRDIQDNNTVKDYYGNYSRTSGFWAFPFVLVNGAENFKIFTKNIGTTQESEEDLRRRDFLINIQGDSYNVFKYIGALRSEDAEGISMYVYGSQTPNWIVYRLSDIVLLKAEALVQLNRFEEAMEMVNLTYLRSNLEDGVSSLEVVNYNSKKEMHDLVLRERQRELMFEGKRWFDLLRMARREDSPLGLVNIVGVKYAGGSGVQNFKLPVMDALYMPIHINEFKGNPNLKQNPFYETESGTITK